VHSLGAVAVPGGSVRVLDAAGNVVASGRFGPLQAPADLLPKTARVQLILPGALAPGARVAVATDGEAAEVTRANNEVAFGVR
jgi:hypothetical protein